LTIQILITGGCGFIGTKLVEQTLHNNKIGKIILYDLLEPPTQLLKQDLEGKIEFVKGDLTNVNLLRENTKGIDQVIHLAAITDVKKCKENPEFSRKINVFGTKNVLEISEQNNVGKIIFASTMSAIYGNSMRFDEEAEPTPISEYGKQKAEAEKLIQNFCIKNNLNGIVLRKSNLFGLGLLPKENVVNLFVKNAVMGNPLKVAGIGSVRNFLHLIDACTAYTNAIFSDIKSPFEIFNITGKDTCSIRDLAFTVKEEISKKTEKTVEIIENNDSKVVPIIPIISTDKAKEMLKYKPKFSLKMGIEELMEDFQKNKS